MNPALFLPIALVFAAGSLISLQAPTNALLARAGGSPLIAALISFGVGTVALAVVWLGSGNRPGMAGFAKLPAYAWFGGLYGALYVAIAAFAAPRIGLATLITIGIAGQLIMGVVLDHYGVMGLPRSPIGILKLAGVALVIGGVVMVRAA